MLPFRAQLLIFVVAAAAGVAQPAWTQTYPTQNITLQVAFPAGGIADVVARLVGQKLSERFELYACGVELANGFGELIDVGEQRKRLEQQMAEKERIYGERYPIDEDFLSALAVMPEACGIALGFDRLVMLATGATRIDEVVWTPMSAP